MNVWDDDAEMKRKQRVRQFGHRESKLHPTEPGIPEIGWLREGTRTWDSHVRVPSLNDPISGIPGSVGIVRVLLQSVFSTIDLWLCAQHFSAVKFPVYSCTEMQ